MPGNTSFYYCIVKKFQVSTATQGAASGHFDDLASDDLAGGFTLKSPNHKYGIFDVLAPIANTFGFAIQGGWRPLNPNSLVPAEIPLYVMLEASLQPSPPATVVVAGQEWPVMPLFPVDHWTEFNTGPHRLIDLFATWIKDGKKNDTPKSFTLTYDAFIASPPTAWPNLPNLNTPEGKETPLLFVASMAGDDGRRHGDHGTPLVPLAHVPDHYWHTSQIFLTDELGYPKYPSALKSGEEYYVAALIGNCGNWGTGRAKWPGTKIQVRCDAMAFNTNLSPGTPLPSLSNRDPAAPDELYEQYYLGPETWDVAGFRFNIDAAFAKIKAGLAGVDLGGATVDGWLKDSHACLKVRIMEGEGDNTFKPDGNVPLTIDSSPRKDRHIAQRNLAKFDITMAGSKQIKWQNFIMAQAGAGPNSLVLQHGLPMDTFRFYVAVPKGTFTRYVAKGGKLAGFEVVEEKARDAPTKPFP